MAGHADKRDVVTAPQRRARYLHHGWWDRSTLALRVDDHANARPDGVAVVDENGVHSYARLRNDAARLASFLRERGVDESSFVSVQLPNRYETVVTAVAVQSIGATINPLLPNYRVHELRHVFATARPHVVLTPAVYRGFDHRDLVREVAEATGVQPLHVVVDDDRVAETHRGQVDFVDALRVSAPPTLASGDPEAISELIFTSGTEATPKAIMHTEQTTNFSVRVAHDDLRLTVDDVVWMPSPVGHSTGFNYGLRFALYHGLPLVLQDRWDPEVAMRLILEHGCSYTLAATTFLQDLAETARRHGVRLDSMRIFGCGGAPVPPALVDAAAEQGITCLRLYGSTEVLVATWNRPWSTARQRRDTDGTAMSHVEVAVVDDDGHVLPPGEEGEIVTRGPNTCVGFFADPQRTTATFTEDGFVRSGDIARLDDEGYLTMVSRKKEIIIRGGVNIAPREVEELLVAFDEIERAAVIGLPDERLGERMCACVVLRSGDTIDLDTVVERLRTGGLATYKLPQRLEVVEALPSTASGKIQKHELVRRIVAADEATRRQEEADV
jgi:non-ribosomal peptide synthetase component E (peptide arylation enzyme)